MLPSLNPNSAQKKKKKKELKLSTLQEMLSYGKNGALWSLQVKYVAGVLTVDKPFLRITQELSGGGRKAELHTNFCRDLDANMLRTSPMLPRHKTGPAEEISVWTSLSFLESTWQNKNKSYFPKVFHMYKAFLMSAQFLPKRKKKSLFLTPQVTFQSHVPHFEWRGWEITFREFSYASCLQK